MSDVREKLAFELRRASRDMSEDERPQQPQGACATCGQSVTHIMAAITASRAELEQARLAEDYARAAHNDVVEIHNREMTAARAALEQAKAERDALWPIARAALLYLRADSPPVLDMARRHLFGVCEYGLTPEQRAALLATTPPPLDVQAGSEGEP